MELIANNQQRSVSAVTGDNASTAQPRVIKKREKGYAVFFTLSPAVAS